MGVVEEVAECMFGMLFGPSAHLADKWALGLLTVALPLLVHLVHVPLASRGYTLTALARAVVICFATAECCSISLVVKICLICYDVNNKGYRSTHEVIKVKTNMMTISVIRVVKVKVVNKREFAILSPD